MVIAILLAALAVLLSVIATIVFLAYSRPYALYCPADVEPVKPSAHDVQFTVYRPRSMVPDRWHSLLAFAHTASSPGPMPGQKTGPAQEVRRQALGILGFHADATHEVKTQDASWPVSIGDIFTVVPRFEGVEFNPGEHSFRWEEDVHRADFRLRAKADLLAQTVYGEITIFLNDVIFASVPLAIPVAEPTEAGESHDSWETETGARYRKIFASYSHKDLGVVLAVERLVASTGDKYLRDWNELRAGEDWDPRLLQLIEEADVFQLFWSRNAMDSEFVRREYEHALRLNRRGFVRPAFWEEPMPEDPARGLPPEALRKLHFHRIEKSALPRDDRDRSEGTLVLGDDMSISPSYHESSTQGYWSSGSRYGDYTHHGRIDMEPRALRRSLLIPMVVAVLAIVVSMIVLLM